MVQNTATKTFGQLSVGTVINYSNCVTADNTDYVVLEQYTDKFGDFTKVLDKSTNELDCFTQHSKVQLHWSIVKEN